MQQQLTIIMGDSYMSTGTEEKKSIDEDDLVLSDQLYKQFQLNMLPGKGLTGKALKILKRELQSSFMIDPKSPNLSPINGVVIDPDATQNKHFVKFLKLVRGMYWLNGVHEKRWTPLTFLIEDDPSDWRTVLLLLNYGADPNVRDTKGRPPLYHLITTQYPVRRDQTLNLLLEEGANPLAFYKGRRLAKLAQDYAKGLDDENDPRVTVWNAIKEKCHLHEWDNDESEDGEY